MASTRALKTVYHLLDHRNWPSVQERGLLSTSRLMALGGSDGLPGLKRQRLQGEQLSCGAFVRDQRPMPPLALARTLSHGLTPDDWYELLNSKVFFWIDPERLNRQRHACGATPQLVLVIDAEKMLAAYSMAAAVTPINTGNAMRAAAPRNLSTIVPYDQWVEDAWAKELIPNAKPRPAMHKPVELTISGAVPDIGTFMLDVIHLAPGAAFQR